MTKRESITLHSRFNPAWLSETVTEERPSKDDS